MRTQASCDDQDKAMTASRVLAEYANLEPEGVEGFSAAHPDFVPAWWFMAIGGRGKGPWMRERDLIREAWGKFQADLILRLVTSHWFTFGTFNRREVSSQEKEWPYQQAVMFLHINPWRAKTCLFCGRRFIAEHPKAKFCGFDVTVDENFNIAPRGIQKSCFWAYRRRSKHLWWMKHSEGINKRRKRDYQTEKQNRRSHAKRKNLRQR